MNDLISFYQKRLGVESALFSRIDHADAMVAVVYKIDLPTGEEFILKVCDRESDYHREIYFLNRLADKIKVPQILQIIPPEKGTSGAILMNCLPGSLLAINELTDSLAYELGRSLAHIHLNRFPGYGDPLQAKLNDDPGTYLTFKFKEGLEECKNHLPPHLVETCRRFYDLHLTHLKAVDGPCIVHRDFRPGNLIVYQGKLQGVIDWVGARASFAEEDLCSIEHEGWLNLYKNAFLSGYRSIRPVPEYDPLLLFLRLNKAIATLGFVVKQGTWEGRDARLYQANSQFLERFITPN